MLLLTVVGFRVRVTSSKGSRQKSASDSAGKASNNCAHGSSADSFTHCAPKFFLHLSASELFPGRAATISTPPGCR